jgi:hypothetical protein
MNELQILSDNAFHKMPMNFLIRYELEIMHRRDLWWLDTKILEQYTRLDQSAKCQRPKVKNPSFWLTTKTPLFHPGRILVSREVMVRLGRTEVLFYLNCFVRGGCSDGAAAGEDYMFRLNFDLMLRSTYWLTNEIGLSIKTNANRTCTVIRFLHESLNSLRCAQRESLPRAPTEVSIPKEIDPDPF